MLALLVVAPSSTSLLLLVLQRKWKTQFWQLSNFFTNLYTLTWRRTHQGGSGTSSHQEMWNLTTGTRSARPWECLLWSLKMLSDKCVNKLCLAISIIPVSHSMLWNVKQKNYVLTSVLFFNWCSNHSLSFPLKSFHLKSIEFRQPYYIWLYLVVTNHRHWRLIQKIYINISY